MTNTEAEVRKEEVRTEQAHVIGAAAVAIAAFVLVGLAASWAIFRWTDPKDVVTALTPVTHVVTILVGAILAWHAGKYVGEGARRRAEA